MKTGDLSHIVDNVNCDNLKQEVTCDINSTKVVVDLTMLSIATQNTIRFEVKMSSVDVVTLQCKE